MRTWRFILIISLAFVAMSVLIWLAMNQKVLRVPNVENTMNEILVPQDFDAEIVRYLSSHRDLATRSAIANDIATKQTKLWESCANKMKAANNEEQLAIAHIASAYFKQGTRQKEELKSILKSSDDELVQGLLTLLVYTVDLGPNGEWQLDKPLGTAEIPPHISIVAMTHPDLATAIVRTLGRYRAFAKGETKTVLKFLVIAKDKFAVFQAKLALQDIDKELYLKFDLGPRDAPLTNDQRVQIEKYLELR